MTLPLLVNVFVAVYVWLGAMGATMLLLRRGPVPVRRIVCRFGLVGAAALLVLMAWASAREPSRGLFVLPFSEAPAESTRPMSPAPAVEAVPRAGGPVVTGSPTTDASLSAGDSPSERGPRRLAEELAARPAADAESAETSAVKADADPAGGGPADSSYASLGAIAAAAAMLIGTLLLAGRLTLRLRRLVQWRRTWTPAGPQSIATLERLGMPTHMRASVQVYLVPGLSQPAAAGFFRPVLLLPQGSMPFERPFARAALAHELGHISGRDPLWTLIGHAVVALVWWCPISFWLRSQTELDNEITADEWALRSGIAPRRYAQTLAELAGGRFAPAAVLTTGIASHLRRRIEMMLNPQRLYGNKPTRLLCGATCALCLALMAMIFAVPAVSVARADEEGGPSAEAREDPRRHAEEGEVHRPAEGEGQRRHAEEGREGRSPEAREGERKHPEEGRKHRPAEGEGQNRHAEGDKGSGSDEGKARSVLGKELARRMNTILAAHRRAIERANRNTAKELVKLARIADRTGERAAAIQLCRQALELDPKNTDAASALKKAGVKPNREDRGENGGSRERDGARDADQPREGDRAREGQRPREGDRAREGERHREGA
jgi:beta-lactamase regulating signal transducer with metallopeptidase domain